MPIAKSGTPLAEQPQRHPQRYPNAVTQRCPNIGQDPHPVPPQDGQAVPTRQVTPRRAIQLLLGPLQAHRRHGERSLLCQAREQ